MKKLLITITEREFVQNCTKHGFDCGENTPDNVDLVIEQINNKYGELIIYYPGASSGTCEYRPTPNENLSIVSEVDRVIIEYNIPTFYTGNIVSIKDE